VEHKDQDQRSNPFYDPDASSELDIYEAPVNEVPRAENPGRWRLRMRHPAVVPVLVLVVFVAILITVTTVIQGRRIDRTERAFQRVVTQQCQQLSHPDSTADLNAMASELDAIANLSQRATSGVFGFVMVDGRELRDQCRALSKAQRAAAVAPPGPQRQASLESLIAAYTRTGLADATRLSLDHLTQRNIREWGDDLTAAGMELPDDGGLPAWTLWLEELSELARHDKSRVAAIRHGVLSHHLAFFEQHWQRGVVMPNYGTAFGAAYQIFSPLQNHRCPAGAPDGLCKTRWEALCSTLFANWVADARARERTGREVTPLLDQFADWQQQAERLQGFHNAKFAVNRLASGAGSR